MIYCFDLDGTLCTDENGVYENAKPFEYKIKKVNELYDKGDTIIIETARGSVSKKKFEYITKKQLKEWGLKYHKLRVGIKIYADIYVDDKCINANNFFLK